MIIHSLLKRWSGFKSSSDVIVPVRLEADDIWMLQACNEWIIEKELACTDQLKPEATFTRRRLQYGYGNYTFPMVDKQSHVCLRGPNAMERLVTMGLIIRHSPGLKLSGTAYQALQQIKMKEAA